jgi:DNA-binding transcriptional regulator LsrR (DeoR family)
MVRGTSSLRDEMADRGPDDEIGSPIAARICWQYFKEGQTQELIAQRLGLTRTKVNRIIGRALDSGLVRITIESHFAPCAELESQLVKRFRLQRAIVVPSPAPDVDVRTVVGAAAGWFVSETLGPDDMLGITWGGTIHAAARNINRRPARNIVVSLVGGVARSGPINPYDNAAMMARALGAPCRYVTAPMLADSPKLRAAFMQSESVAHVFALVPKISMALLSAIDLTSESKALEYEVISRDQWTMLRKDGLVGDIAGQYLDANGHSVPNSISELVVAPPLQDLKRIKLIVLAAGGAHKTPVILAGIRAGLCHVLITDEAAALALLSG